MTAVFRWRFACITTLCFLLLASGCCRDPHSVYRFAFFEGDYPAHGFNWSYPPVSAPRCPELGLVSERVVLRDGAEPLEVYDSAGERVEVSRRSLRGLLGGDPHSDCGLEGVAYDLDPLPAGDYVLVHRQSAAPVGGSFSAGGWTTFDGEPALVATIRLNGPGGSCRRDAGLADGGM